MIETVDSISVNSITLVDSKGFSFIEKSVSTQKRECKLRQWDNETQQCTTQFVLQETSTTDSNLCVYSQSASYFVRYSPDTGDHAVMQLSTKSVLGRAATKKYKSKSKFIVASESEPGFFLCVGEDAICHVLVVKAKVGNPIRLSSEIKLRTGGNSKVVAVLSAPATVSGLLFTITYANGNIELWRADTLFQVMKKKAYGVKKKNSKAAGTSADAGAEDEEDDNDEP